MNKTQDPTKATRLVCGLKLNGELLGPECFLASSSQWRSIGGFNILLLLLSLLLGATLNHPLLAYDESQLRKLEAQKNCVSCDLSEADLANAKLVGAMLSGADLSGTDLAGANLANADLGGAKLNGAILVNSNLSGANLVAADLSKAYLYKAVLMDSNLSYATLEGARLSDADLTGANLVGAQLSPAIYKQDWATKESPGISVNEAGDYPRITSFDFSGHTKYMTSKSGKLYRSKKGTFSRYAEYVRTYPDLLAAYKTSTGLTIDEMGRSHWEKHGQYESRRLPTLPSFQIVLDLALDPQFRSDQEVGLLSVITRNNLIYLSYTIHEGGADADRHGYHLVVDEYSEEIEKIRTIIKINTAAPAHNAGTLVFDQSGRLYLSVGEGRISDYESQDVDSLLGKILRIDISNDNPETEVIAYGLRNPWKISIDSSKRMFIGDCGEETIESIYLLDELDPTMPYNLGWPVFEGSRKIFSDDPLRYEHTLAPIYEYAHHNSIGLCAIGGMFLDHLGIYIFGDYLGRIRLLQEQANGKWYEIHSHRTRGILSLGVDLQSNEIYFSGWDKIYRLVINKEDIGSYPRVVLCRTTMPDGSVNNSGCR